MGPVGQAFFVVLVIAFSGCFGAGSKPAPFAEEQGCVHPFPCGDEWPADLIGPFDLATREAVEIASHDGVMLHGWLWRPALPAGVGSPTILMSTPYLSAEDGQAQMANLYEPPILRNYIPNGYAFLVVEVRGTGASGGCFGHHDMDAQLDPAALVEWIAAQSWSNGRVGMAGISYMGVTSIHGAIHAGPALKAVAPVAVPQQYLYHFTPQGAFSTSAAGYEATQHTLETPPLYLADGAGAVGSLDHVAERWCDEYARNMLVEPRAMMEDDRDGPFWLLRDSFAGYPDITAALFLVEGFDDPYVPWGQDVAWRLLDAPTRMMFGQWGHEMPPLANSAAERLAWFDYWLKGVGPAPRLGVVYEDDAGTWRNATAWPPSAGKTELLYLVEGGLAAEPASASASYRSLPVGPGRTLHEQMCGAGDALRFTTEPLSAPAVIAGNPLASLSISSDAVGGLIGLYLYRIPAAGCDAATLLTWGAADLRFHAGNLVAEDFPVGEPVTLRIDFEMIAARLHMDDQIGLLVTHPGPIDDRDLDDLERVQPHGPGSAGRAGQPYLPTITLHGTSAGDSSHLALPLVEATVGGVEHVVSYPDRPFSGPSPGR